MVKKFAEIFSGLKRSYGISININIIREDGKNEYDSKVLHKPVTEDLYKKHLDGIKPTLGIVAINENNECRFGCIDIDTYPVDHLKYIKILKENKIPALVFKSKSKGAHIYLFTKEFVKPSIIRIKLREIAATLGHAGAEIFPKQDYVEEGDTGSFLNLPYDGGDNTERYCLDDNGNKLSLEQFYKRYDEVALTENQIMNPLENSKEEDDFVGAPPCLISILKEKQAPGEMRNVVLHNVAIYLKKRFPNEVSQKLFDYNTKYCDPPLPENEINNTVLKSLNKKDYNYDCKKAPLINFCNSKKCRLQKFGVGKGYVPCVIEEIKIYPTDPPIFKVVVDGQPVDVKAEELNDPKLFANASLRQTYKTFPSVPINLWREMVQEQLAKKVVIKDMPDSLKIEVRLEEALLNYFKNTPAKELQQITMQNRSYIKDGKCYFKPTSLQDYLKKHDWEKKWNETTLLIKKYYKVTYKNERLGNTQCRYWILEGLKIPEKSQIIVSKIKPAEFEK